jgi:hypothetical protein
MFKKRSVGKLLQSFVNLQTELVAHNEEQTILVEEQRKKLDEAELELTRAARLKLKIDDLLNE